MGGLTLFQRWTEKYDRATTNVTLGRLALHWSGQCQLGLFCRPPAQGRWPTGAAARFLMFFSGGAAVGLLCGRSVLRVQATRAALAGGIVATAMLLPVILAGP